jgi:hypothetical protein
VNPVDKTGGGARKWRSNFLSVAAYLLQAQAELPFEPIGFGMWADRPEMQDATKWVEDLREREWTR